MKPLLCSFFLTTLLLISSVQAFGSVQNTKNLSVVAGEKTSFNLLLFPTNDVLDPLVRFEVIGPENWEITIDPSPLSLNPETATEHLLLNDVSLPVSKTTITVHVPKETLLGTYVLAVRAIQDPQEGGFAVGQVRLFTVDVNVIAPPPFSDVGETEPGMLPPIGSRGEPFPFLSDIVQEKNIPSLIFFIALAIVLIAAWRIYRS
ncbi:MAG: hypothetical protein KKA90_05070 [Nanoarchaeota archaeon]|nr:hypothetical protein [Nanoarchaeota archaeon]